MSERAAPYYCPYCGDEDLEPHEAAGERGAGHAWACGACARVFQVRFVGLRAGAIASTAHGTGTGEDA
ncbi:hypothetical protein [Marinitenerispora sediminis]|uniref:Insertion element protein n=1 Tax=Marinitenerispora sediminis TaxID=1931232 RepID=A0A368SZN0_9ACTN|nr:hypothetical protein [Marinitenerispora sediminis]RCV51530.1 hypothetical protein DEF24_23095 [Marinitenerispora sediminis]RCV52479.1 hypothetical protein DEF28_12915 [Marinitenerispora sediminis]RCV62187.1 hypothetical protein DEF23_00290 [Marinitenerispora sediminis]